MSTVRVSNWRHVYAEYKKDTTWLLDVKAKLPSGDTNYLAANSSYLAFPAGASYFQVLSQKQSGKLPTQKMFQGHKGQVIDLAFSPFSQNILVSGGQDCSIGVWDVSCCKEEGVETPTDMLVQLKGHIKKVQRLKFHPSANNVLGSFSADKTVKFWDIQKTEVQSSIKAANNIFDFDYNITGNQIVITGRDKKITIFDVRSGKEVAKAKCHRGGKPARVVWCKRLNKIVTCGFSKSADREIFVYDLNKMEEGPVSETEIDQQSGIMMPFYDEDNSVLVTVGKGDSSFKHYEIDNQGEMLHFLGVSSFKFPWKGCAVRPKLSVDTDRHVIADFYQLTTNSIIPIEFRVPRKNPNFEKELYPDTFGPVAAISSDDFFGGKDAEPINVPMDPENRPQLSGGSFEKKKSKLELALEEIEQLKAENEELKKKIAELEK